jgi:hypothetical protein
LECIPILNYLIVLVDLAATKIFTSILEPVTSSDSSQADRPLLSSGFNRLREHYGLTSNKLKEHATARNLIIGPLAVTCVGAAMINPVTRVALCTLISMAYTMSLMTLHLMMIGLYLSWKGFGAVATMAKDCISGYNATANATQTLGNLAQLGGAPNGNPPEGVPAIPTLVNDDVVNTQGEKTGSALPTSTPASVQADTVSASAPRDDMDMETDEGDSVDNMNVEADRSYSDMPDNGHEIVSIGTVEDEVFSTAWTEGSAQNQPTTASILSTGPVTDMGLDEYVQFNPVDQLVSGAASGNAASGNAWASELASQAGSLTGWSPHVSLPRTENWVTEFAQEQARHSGPSLLRCAGGALAVGAGVFAVWNLYKAMQNPASEEEDEQSLTYVNMPEPKGECYSLASYPHRNWKIFDL